MRYSYLLFLLVAGGAFLQFQNYHTTRIVNETSALLEPVPLAAKPDIQPKLIATLVEPQKYSEQKRITVLVRVMGLQMKAEENSPHLHYRLNDGPEIGTVATRLNFYDVHSGLHSISLMLVGPDHAPLGPKETLQIGIP